MGIMVVFAALLCVPSVGGDCKPCSSADKTKARGTGGQGPSLAEGLLDEPLPSRERSMAESIGLVPEESTPCQALQTLDCWLLMWADSWAQASGMMISTNLGQLVESSGASGSAFFVSIFSVGNCMGRVFIGLSSDAAVRRGIPRSIGLFCVSVMFTAMGLFGTHIDSTWVVTVVVVLGGLGMGAINGLEPAIVSEMVRVAALVLSHCVHSANDLHRILFIVTVLIRRFLFDFCSLDWKIWVQTTCFCGLGSSEPWCCSASGYLRRSTRLISRRWARASVVS